ncbi:MAG: C13 family peptidase [Caldilineaceae bacterium]
MHTSLNPPPARYVYRRQHALWLSLAALLLLPLLFVAFRADSGTPALHARALLALGGSAIPQDSSPDTPPFTTDRLAIELTEVTAPPADRSLNAYLLKGESSTGLRCADLPVSNGGVNTNCDFPGQNLIRYDTLTFVQESTVFSTTLPAGALSYLRQALAEASGPPHNTAYGIGLKNEAKLLADHAGFANDAASSGNLSTAKRHTEHVLNILYGASDVRYGDQDNDGVATNPGDGYGLLLYRQKLYDAVQAAAEAGDATPNIQTRAAEVQTALNNIGAGNGDGGWADLFIAKAEALLAESDATAAQTLAAQMAGLATRIYQGEELNDNGEIEPIVGEGGAQTAWRYTQYAADYLTTDGAGYVRYADSSSAASNDALRIKLAGLPPANAGEQYWVYLVSDGGEYFLAGALDGAGGALDAALTASGRNLAQGFKAARVTVGYKIAEDKLPTTALGYLCTTLDTAQGTPGATGYGVGLATQAQILAAHAGFARDAAQAGNLTGARQHAEHVLNILYGENDGRYGDHDNDGLPTNPGDGYGLLPYRQQMDSTLTLAAESIDATDNIRTRVAQVQTALTNIGDGAAGSSRWAALLIESTEGLLAVSSAADAQPFAAQMAGLAGRIYSGEDLNDNGQIEPIQDEGGALVAFRYAQRAAEYFPQAVDAPVATPTPATTITPETTATPNVTGTPTAVTPPPLGSDSYESDDQCSDARAIATDGIVQRRNFHQIGDSDWVKFDATAGEQYLIEVSIPDNSAADVALEMLAACGGAVLEAQDFQFSPGVRLDYTAASSGALYMKFTNHDPSRAGDDVAYELAVRQLSATAAPGLLIIVAGQIKNNDPVQPNIYHVTDAVYQLFKDKGATDDQIYYLAPDLSRTGVDASATAANLEAAITQWADEQAATAQSLTLYLMDHGGQDIFYLDKLRSEWITPTDLHGWLNKLESLRPTLNINVIYEACESGSFISGDGSISKPGRVVIASTDDVNLAWASDDGAIFSDHFLNSLRRGESLYTSFRSAQIAAQIAHPQQQPWIDGDGDGVGTDDASQTVAAQRGFAFAGTFPDEIWPPFIAEVQQIEPDEQGRGVLRAQVRDDVNVDSVWAVIYPPSYRAPAESEELVQEALPTAVLLDQGNDWYGARFDGFSEKGTYRVVFYADDNQGVHARPLSVEVQLGSNDVYLPLIMR